LDQLKFRITTTPDINGDITQILSSEFGDVRQDIMRTVFHAQAAQLKEALVKMGWTPPVKARVLLGDCYWYYATKIGDKWHRSIVDTQGGHDWVDPLPMREDPIKVELYE